MAIKLKRAYDPPAAADGYRVLVDRLWPRGIKKTDAKVDDWLREIAPSNELRKWFGHDVERWPEFKKRYAAELKPNAAVLRNLARKARKETVTLLFGAKDEEHNNAVVIRDYLKRRR